jgi:hypothetical protein
VLPRDYDLAKLARKKVLGPGGASWLFLAAPLITVAWYLTMPLLIPVLTSYASGLAGRRSRTGIVRDGHEDQLSRDRPGLEHPGKVRGLIGRSGDSLFGSHPDEG